MKIGVPIEVRKETQSLSSTSMFVWLYVYMRFYDLIFDKSSSIIGFEKDFNCVANVVLGRLSNQQCIVDKPVCVCFESVSVESIKKKEHQ